MAEALKDCTLELLQEKSPSLKRKGIANVRSWIQQKQTHMHDIWHLFMQQLAKPLTNLILDSSESVRESTLQLLLYITESLQQRVEMDYLQILIPAIWTQLGCYESMQTLLKYMDESDKQEQDDDFKTLETHLIKQAHYESSEEVRKLMVQLLLQIIDNDYEAFLVFCDQPQNKKHCLQYLSILHVLFGDKCPQIRSTLCQTLLNEFSKYGKIRHQKQHKLLKYIFADYAEYLCLSLATGCKHQRGKIRLISFQLLSEIIVQNMGITEQISPWITDDEKIWKYVSYLSFDQMQYIKQAVSTSAVEWICLLRGKIDSEHEVQYAKIWMLVLNENGLHILKQSQLTEIEIKKELLSCIAFIITLCNEKLTHWQSSHRLLGIQSLIACITCLQNEFPGKYVVSLLPSFVNLMDAQQENVQSDVSKCLRLIGSVVSIQQISEFLFSKINDSQVSLIPYLRIAAHVFAGLTAENMNAQTLSDICASLSSACRSGNGDEIRVGTELLRASNSLLAACRCLLNEDSVSEILWMIIQIHASWLKHYQPSLSSLQLDESHEIHREITKTLDFVSQSEQIWETHFPALYGKIERELQNGQGQYLFASLICYSKTFVSKYMKQILPIFRQINDENKSETLRYALLSILCSLISIEDVEHSNTADDYGECMQFILVDILLPNLVWKAGKFRYKMRLLALESMRVLYAHKAVDAAITWNCRQKLVSTVQSRLDDFQCEIRKSAVQLITLLLTELYTTFREHKSECILAEKEMDSLCTSILDRYDDSNDEVRTLTCSALNALIQCMDETNISCYSKIIETSFIHLDDSNKILQNEIFSLLKDASGFDVEEFERHLKSVDGEKVQPDTLQLLQRLAQCREQH